MRGEIAGELGEVFCHLGFPGAAGARGWRRVPTPLLTYLRVLAEPDVLTGRWAMFRGCPRPPTTWRCVTCGGFGLGHTGTSGAVVAAFAAGGTSIAVLIIAIVVPIVAICWVLADPNRPQRLAPLLTAWRHGAPPRRSPASTAKSIESMPRGS